MDYALKKTIVSRNALFTIPFKGTLFATTETLDILIFLQTSGNHLSYPSIIINCNMDPFLKGADLAFNG